MTRVEMGFLFCIFGGAAIGSFITWALMRINRW